MTEDQIRNRIRDLEEERVSEAGGGGGLTSAQEQELAGLQQQLTDLQTAADDKAAAATANLPTGITQDNLSRFVETDADGNPIVKVDATTNQQYYDIREDLAGGEITDRRRRTGRRCSNGCYGSWRCYRRTGRGRSAHPFRRAGRSDGRANPAW